MGGVYSTDGKMRNAYKGKVDHVFLLTEYHAMKAYRASGGRAPSILDLGTRWR
jgi:hypothetical protein